MGRCSTRFATLLADAFSMAHLAGRTSSAKMRRSVSVDDRRLINVTRQISMTENRQRSGGRNVAPCESRAATGGSVKAGAEPADDTPLPGKYAEDDDQHQSTSAAFA